MEDFSGRMEDGETFLRRFEAKCVSGTDQEKIKWFRSLVAPRCPDLFRGVDRIWNRWAQYRSAFAARYTVASRPRDLLRAAEKMTQGEDEPTAAYILRIEESLKTLDLEQNYDMAVDALFEGMRPAIWLGATDIRKRKYPWSKLVSKLIQLEYDLGGPSHTKHAMLGYANFAAPDTKPKKVYSHLKLSREAFRELKELMPFPQATGCWLCGEDEHRAASCAKRPAFDAKHPKFALKVSGKGRQE